MWPTELQRGVDFAGLRYGGNGYYNLSDNEVCVVPNGGCTPSDFTSVIPGCIALIQLLVTDDCQLIDKAMGAQNASAAGVIIYNNQERTTLLTSRVRHPDWYPGLPLMTIPVLTGSYTIGSLLSQSNLTNPIRLHLVTNSTIDIVETYNVFCVTMTGDPNTVIVVGAHLDSVPEGPGLNDNGSGSSTLLEIVLQWYSLGLSHANKIQFSWWGSEEVGLIGSRHFVRDLKQNNPAEFEKIAMNLNFDMLGSPNYFIGVHDGSTAVAAQNGSMVITNMFVEYFELLQLDYKFVDLIAGSDFVPFVEADIPAGGVTSGAGGIKSEDERITYGGTANAAYDSCYHQSCDTSYNINPDALNYLAGAAAYVFQKVAQETNLREILTSPILVKQK